MLRFLHRYLLPSLSTPKLGLLLDVPFLQYPNLRLISTISEPTDSTSFTQQYLINSCGLSPETALSTAQKIHIKSTSKPNSVLNLFHNYNFSQTQISQIISKYPQVILSNPEKILKPKLNFLKQSGFTDPNLTTLVSTYPSILSKGLKNQFIPSFEYLKKLLGTDENVLIAFKRSTWVLRHDLEKIMEPNVEILRHVGVPESNISKLLLYNPRALMMNTSRFLEVVVMLMEIGFNPLSIMFVHGLRVMIGMTKSNWERKVEVYKELGWSEDEILLTFRTQPMCMNFSEEMIRKKMNIFLSILKWTPKQISSNPAVFTLSVEKRIVPRCAVLRVLKSQGVLSKFSEAYALKMADKRFLEKFVLPYGEKVPDVVKAYQGKIG